MTIFFNRRDSGFIIPLELALKWKQAGMFLILSLPIQQPFSKTSLFQVQAVRGPKEDFAGDSALVARLLCQKSPIHEQFGWCRA
jgi:hypothetical protein